MEAEIVKQDIVIVLKLDVREAVFLKALVQNYLGFGDESTDHAKIREDIFNALKKLGVK